MPTVPADALADAARSPVDATPTEPADVISDAASTQDAAPPPDAGDATDDATSSRAEADGESWTALPTFPGPSRRHALNITLGSKFYVAGGLHFDPHAGWTELQDLWVYDTLAHSWEARQDMPGPVQQGGLAWVYTAGFAVSVAGELFIQTGGDTWRYHAATDQWTATSGFPGDTEGCPRLFTDGTLLYAGLGGHTEMQMIGGYNLTVMIRDPTIYRLDLSSMQWSFHGSVPAIRDASASIHLESRDETALLVRGEPTDSWQLVFFNPESLTLQAAPSLPFANDDAPACLADVNGQLVVAGYDRPETYLDPDAHDEHIYVLDEALGVWEPVYGGPLETLRGDLQGPTCAGVGDTLYTGLGYTVPHAPPVVADGATVTHLAAGDLISGVAIDAESVSTWGWRSQWPFETFEDTGPGLRDLDAAGAAMAMVDAEGRMHATGSCVFGADTPPPPHLDGDLTRVEVGCYGAMGLTTSGALVTATQSDPMANADLPPGTSITDISLGGNGHYGLVLDDLGGVHAVGAAWAVGDLPSAVQSGVVAIAAGSGHALALSESGEVIAWGDNSQGETDVPPDLPGETLAIDAAEAISAALSDGGVLTCWGWLCESYLTIPDALQGHIVAMRLGAEHILVQLDDGTLRDIGNVRGTGPNPSVFARKL